MPMAATQTLPDARGRFGPYGGRYVPETLMFALEQLTAAYEEARHDPAFQAEFHRILHDYVGRPSPLYFAERLTKEAGGARIYLKREDLNHTGAHKINNAIGQALLTKRMGKPRIIAETGAGQHGVATATAAALFGLPCRVYMGAEDVRRQKLNVFKMRAMGTEVFPVESGSRRRCGTPSTRRCATGWRPSRHALHHRQRRRPAPVPDDGPRLPVGHRRGDEGAVPRADRPAAGRGRRLRRRRQQRGRHVLPVRRRHAASSWSASRPAARAQKYGEHAATLSLRQAGRAARHASATSCRTTTARRPPCIRSRPASITPASARSTATGRTPAACATRSVDDDGGARGLPRCAAGWRASCRPWRRPTRSSRRCGSPRSRPKTDVVVLCFSGRGDKDCAEVARLEAERQH